MQTFIPYSSFPHSVAVLDRARLGKQRVENYQLLRSIAALEGETDLPIDLPVDLASMIGERRKVGWRNHPALLMWRGHKSALAVYATFTLREWEARGYQNNMIYPYTADWQPNPEAREWLGDVLPLTDVRVPDWLGEPTVHISHQSNLLRKKPEWYERFGWRVSPDLPYVWPTQIGLEFSPTAGG